MEYKHSDYWTQDGFEDELASIIIAQYEKKVRKNRGAYPGDRMTDQIRQMLFKRDCPYVPSNSRVTIFNEDAKDHGLKASSLDLVNDPHLPDSGCMALGHLHGKLKETQPGVYANFFFFKRIQNLPRNWKVISSGHHYSTWIVAANNEGSIKGERHIVTVDKNGNVLSARHPIPTDQKYLENDMDVLARQYEVVSYWALSAIQDKRFCWSITASDGTARVALGCMQEEIKSLLYARSLPLTATGRKRPILHLVAAHKRRLQQGIDIDVSQYLRGVINVEMDGTNFRVDPPSVLIQKLKNSK